ncbi:hypothetical protein [Nocardiopsis sp. LOL_012]|uniref:hypothetical protein n=1 Tax=Nocardiopsis sp. LOL_012 TaxID=3345409 RepID=UPI003A88D686
MSHREEFRRELLRTLSFSDSGYVRGLRAFLYSAGWPVADFRSEPISSFAEDVTNKAFNERRVGELVRIIVYREFSSSSACRLAQRFECHIKKEENNFLLDRVRERNRSRAEQIIIVLRDMLSALPFASGANVYRRVLEQAPYEIQILPNPVSLWEVFKDISDTVSVGVESPVLLLARELADSHPRVARMLQDWCDLNNLGTGETSSGTGTPVPGEISGTARNPRSLARLLVWVRCGEDSRYLIDAWKILGSSSDGEPDVDQIPTGDEGQEQKGVRWDAIGHEVYDLFERFEGMPEVEACEHKRLELTMSAGLHVDLAAPWWKPRKTVLDDPVRLGAKTEIIGHLEEFLKGQDSDHETGYKSFLNRWRNINESGTSIMFDEQCETIPPGVHLSEYASHDGLILFSHVHERGQVLARRVRETALVGVPVIAWRLAKHARGHGLRRILAGDARDVELASVRSLPKLLHLSRSGHPYPGNRGISDGMDMGLIYHDQEHHPLERPWRPLAPGAGSGQPEGGEA